VTAAIGQTPCALEVERSAVPCTEVEPSGVSSTARPSKKAKVGKQQHDHDHTESQRVAALVDQESDAAAQLIAQQDHAESMRVAALVGPDINPNAAHDTIMGDTAAIAGLWAQDTDPNMTHGTIMGDATAVAGLWALDGIDAATATNVGRGWAEEELRGEMAMELEDAEIAHAAELDGATTQHSLELLTMNTGYTWELHARDAKLKAINEEIDRLTVEWACEEGDLQRQLDEAREQAATAAAHFKETGDVPDDTKLTLRDLVALAEKVEENPDGFAGVPPAKQAFLLNLLHRLEKPKKPVCELVKQVATHYACVLGMQEYLMLADVLELPKESFVKQQRRAGRRLCWYGRAPRVFDQASLAGTGDWYVVCADATRLIRWVGLYLSLQTGPFFTGLCYPPDPREHKLQNEIHLMFPKPSINYLDFTAQVEG
jgi:hypothetical protein